MAVVTQTDCPKSVGNRCVIDVFSCNFLCCLLTLLFSDGIGAFVIGLTQISSYFSAQGALGTNPLSLAAPGNDGDSFVLDMATTVGAYGKVSQ